MLKKNKNIEQWFHSFGCGECQYSIGKGPKEFPEVVKIIQYLIVVWVVQIYSLVRVVELSVYYNECKFYLKNIKIIIKLGVRVKGIDKTRMVGC